MVRDLGVIPGGEQCRSNDEVKTKIYITVGHKNKLGIV
jgi:hypothetical protein